MKRCIMIATVLVPLSLCVCSSVHGEGNSKILSTAEQQQERLRKRKAYEAEQLEVDRAALGEAFKAAETSGKHVFVMVKSKSCGWCRILDKVLREEPKIASVVESNYIHVNMTYSSFKALLPGVKYMGMIPNIAILAGDKKLVKRFNPVNLETKNPMGYDTEKLRTFLLKWGPENDKPGA
jgi:thioredoxin-related protein